MGHFVDYLIAPTSAPTKRDVTDVLADVLNVKDFGAIGNGIHDDGPAMQAAIDKAYGPEGAPNGDARNLNKAVFFPAGTYRTGQQLFLNNVSGAYLRGAGQWATRIVYDGPDSSLPAYADVTSLLACKNINYSRIEGITFDVTDSNASICVLLTTFPATGSDGTGTKWFSVGFIGGRDGLGEGAGVANGPGSSGGTGSEQLFFGCTFRDCDRGFMLNNGNGLNYTFIGGRMVNCTRGINAVVGGVNFVMGVDFETNSELDIYVKQQQCPVIIGCRSNSANFALVGPAWIAGVHYNPPSAGAFWTCLIDDQDDPKFIADGCFAGANASLGGSIPSQHWAYLRGSTFLNGTAVSGFGGTVKENI